MNIKKIFRNLLLIILLASPSIFANPKTIVLSYYNEENPEVCTAMSLTPAELQNIQISFDVSAIKTPGIGVPEIESAAGMYLPIMPGRAMEPDGRYNYFGYYTPYVISNVSFGNSNAYVAERIYLEKAVGTYLFSAGIFIKKNMADEEACVVHLIQR